MLLKSAKRTGTRPSELLAITDEWAAVAWDLALEAWASMETGRRMGKATSKEGAVVFPTIDLARGSEV